MRSSSHSVHSRHRATPTPEVSKHRTPLNQTDSAQKPPKSFPKTLLDLPLQLAALCFALRSDPLELLFSARRKRDAKARGQHPGGRARQKARVETRRGREECSILSNVLFVPKVLRFEKTLLFVALVLIASLFGLNSFLVCCFLGYFVH